MKYLIRHMGKAEILEFFILNDLDVERTREIPVR